MLNTLKWETLESQRTKARLVIFYKVLHSLSAVSVPAIITPKPKPRPGYPHQLLKPLCLTDAYRLSFFPRTLSDWNDLPCSVASMCNIEQFKTALAPMSF